MNREVPNMVTIMFVHSEYMCSIVEQRVLGNVETYLNIDTFRKEEAC